LNAFSIAVRLFSSHFCLLRLCRNHSSHVFCSVIVAVGIVNVVLAFLLCVCALFRARYDIADTDDADDTLSLLGIPTVGQEHKQSFGRTFVTAGNVVALVAFVLAGTEIALFVLVLQL
jgi:hypothetical protein